jgi:hypothetical protein
VYEQLLKKIIFQTERAKIKGVDLENTYCNMK